MQAYREGPAGGVMSVIGLRGLSGVLGVAGAAGKTVVTGDFWTVIDVGRSGMWCG